MALLTGLLDLEDLGLGFLVCVFLGLLVALGVLCCLIRASVSDFFPYFPLPLFSGMSSSRESGVGWLAASHLRLKLLELGVLVRAVGFYLFLSLVAGFLNPLSAVYLVLLC